MAGKRANGEGSPRRRKDGRWEWPVRIDGRRHFIYGKTKEEARAKYEALKREHEQGLDLGAKTQTVEAYLDRWVTDVAEKTLRPRTVDYYKSCIRRYITPVVGKVQLNKLTPQHVQRMVNKLPEDLSPYTVRNIRAILRRALNQALTWRLVTYNAAQGVAMPKIEKYEARIPTEEEAIAFRQAIKDADRELLYLLAMFLGLRRGEVLGLLREDIDLKKGELRITGQIQLIRGEVKRVPTKTQASRRTLPIPDLLVPLMEKALAEHPDNPLLFPSETGTPIRPRNLITQFKALLQKAGLPDTIRFHDLRHFAATMMLATGRDLASTQYVLGHTDASITLNFYAHALPNNTRVVVNEVVNAAMKPKTDEEEGSTEP